MVIIGVAFRLFLWLIITLIVIPVGTFINKFLPNFTFHMTRTYHKLFCKIIGIKVEVKGDISKDKPTLFVSNHMGYLDIPVLGSIIPASFVSKKEVRNWPVIGFLATLQKTIFIKRETNKAAKHSNILIDRIKDGCGLIVFPEGTSYNGSIVLPFKSSLFSVANQKFKYNKKDEKFIKVQPVSISFSKLNGELVGYQDKQFYSWVGDETFFGHLIKFISLGKKTVTVTFHPVVSMDVFEDRKDMAKYCRDVVAQSI